MLRDAHDKNDVKMDFADTLLDRRMFSTDTNEYATGLNDENLVYNESGFERERIY